MFVVGSGDSVAVCRFFARHYYFGNSGPVSVGYGHRQTAAVWVRLCTTSRVRLCTTNRVRFGTINWVRYGTK